MALICSFEVESLVELGVGVVYGADGALAFLFFVFYVLFKFIEEVVAHLRAKIFLEIGRGLMFLIVSRLSKGSCREGGVVVDGVEL